MKDDREPKRDKSSGEAAEPLNDRIVWDDDDTDDGYAIILTGVPPSEKLRGKSKKASGSSK